MPIIYILSIAFSVALDAFIVSVAYGFELKKANFKKLFLISFSFAVFQMIMPLLGFFLSSNFKKFIAAYSHWVVFVILFAVGGKMIYDSIWVEENVYNKSEVNLKILIILSIATSIDAFTIGITFGLMECGLAFPILTIGIITFLLCITGVYIGKFFGRIIDERFDIIGGIILILIGLKILLENLTGVNF